jgi:hypothetical protein
MAGAVAVKASSNKVFHLIAPTILPSQKMLCGTLKPHGLT